MLNLSFRFLIVPLAAIVTIAALATQAASHATTRAPVATPMTEELVDCTQANRNTIDICIIADSVAH